MQNNNELKPPFLDSYIKAALLQSGNKCNPYSGEYATLICGTDSDDEEYALEIRNALYRAARRLGKELHTDVYKGDDGKWLVKFTVIKSSYVKSPDFRNVGKNWHH